MTPPFVETTSAPPHPLRTKQLLATHPELRGLIGRCPSSAAIALGLVTAQLTIGWWLSTVSWSWPWAAMAAIAAALLIGAHLVHALYAVIHEAAHQLVFRARWANQAVALLCNVPLVVPFAIALSHYHLVHHRHQGRLGRDPDLPSAWERRRFAGGPARKLAYACCFPLLQLARVVHPDDRLRFSDRWLIANVALQLCAVMSIGALLGGNALIYLLASTYFWAGPHPLLFARYVQEHFITSGDGHETHSYYGPLNRVALNIGYHVEHHDLPSIPWNRLPQLRRLAPSFYSDRTCHRAWWRLGWQFLVDPRIQVASRVAR